MGAEPAPVLAAGTRRCASYSTAWSSSPPTFIGITLVAFIFIRRLPGDPVLLMAGERAARWSAMPS